jgi:hypothetical protein
MPYRSITIEELNGWLSEVGQLALLYNIPVDLSAIAWIGRYQRALSPGQALEEECPALHQLDLFGPPLPV